MEQLIPTVQHYAWGHEDFIANLQGRRPSGRPEAELWMGAHRSSPSILARTGERLDAHIARDPEGQLGAAARFGALPFLAKVVAAARPLSIQTHPTAEQARAGYERENAAGIPLDDPTRIYRDANHKPELICALTRFEAKCGFRPLGQSRALFDLVGGAALGPVREQLGVDGEARSVYAQLLDWLLALDPRRQAELVGAAASAARSAGDGGPFDDALRWSARLAELHPGDVSVVVALLLNHVVLRPGEAMFLGAGNLHSYLVGAGVELMANSDNVVRCGLTEKHVDRRELLRIVDCSPRRPEVQTPHGPTHAYHAPVAEFGLTRSLVSGERRCHTGGPEILLVTEGEVRAAAPSESTPVALRPGWPLWIPASLPGYDLDGAGTMYRFAVGQA